MVQITVGKHLDKGDDDEWCDGEILIWGVGNLPSSEVTSPSSNFSSKYAQIHLTCSHTCFYTDDPYKALLLIRWNSSEATKSKHSNLMKSYNPVSSTDTCH